jgi:hypothetical protein
MKIGPAWVSPKAISVYIPQTRFTYGILLGVQICEHGLWISIGRGYMIDTKDRGHRWFNVKIGRQFA